MLNETSLREFYEHVYPVELVTQWLAYSLSATTDSVPETSPVKSAAGATTTPQKAGVVGDDSNDDADKENTMAASQSPSSAEVKPRTMAVAESSYLARREFCFTLLGDIFTRFRSYGSATELRAELVRCFPEKIDAGAVYNMRPNQKQNVGSIVPQERELVFDIDMSDYDNVRSCCSGKSICRYCWAWMSCAAHVLRQVLQEDFGFKYILPVFSGRRGVHLWVCDRRARRMHDDERAALVGYLTVIAPKTMRGTLLVDLAFHRPIHPTIRQALRRVIDQAFTALFLSSGSENPNNVQFSPKAATVVYDAFVTVLKLGRREQLQRFLQHVDFHEGSVLEWATLRRGLGNSDQEAMDILHAVELLLMYPRLDEHVSTRRDHLLKLPFCVHPATGSLCCPLEWSALDEFDPLQDAPKLRDILLERHIDVKWLVPLQRMLAEMGQDPDETTLAAAEKSVV